uniref:Elongation factor Tu n=1 Tax=Pseudomonas phage Cygsa01 TaxID=3138529 RepID=A0AAU6W3Q8_9VIRU
MGKIAIIGAGNDSSWAQQMVAAMKSEHPEYEVLYIDSCTDMSNLQMGDTFDLVLCDEATKDGINERNGFTPAHIEALNELRQPINVGTIGHVDHNARRLQRNSVSGMLSLKASAKLMARSHDWPEPRERIGKGQRKANKAARWTGGRY